MTVIIRPYHSNDAEQIHSLFHHSIRTLASKHYSQAQIEAWAAPDLNIEFWQRRLARTQPSIAMIQQDNRSSIAGFSEFIVGQGYIDCLYVHPDHAGQGIATILLNQIVHCAKKYKLPKLHVDASHGALKLFSNAGFTNIGQNSIVRNGVTLTNWKMQKIIT